VTVDNYRFTVTSAHSVCHVTCFYDDKIMHIPHFRNCSATQVKEIISYSTEAYT